MKLDEITKIEELLRYADVNQYLGLGWKILNTYTTAADTMGPAVAHQQIHYVLGWTGENPQYPPPQPNPWDEVLKELD